MTSNLDYKKYSLNKLQEWVHDALSCGEASPHEIYSTIRKAAQEDYQYYKDNLIIGFRIYENYTEIEIMCDKIHNYAYFNQVLFMLNSENI